MSLALPEPISRYYAADARRDEVAVAACFAPDAVVVDERRTHAGREAIARWKADASAKYDYSSVPTAIARDGNRFLVTAHVAGSFPGSPVDLCYAFTLDGDAIARLEIVG